MRYLLIIILFLAPLRSHAQCLVFGEIGSRIPSFNQEFFIYLDTIVCKNEITINRIVLNSNSKPDTIAHFKSYRELIFKYPGDSAFIVKEIITRYNSSARHNLQIQDTFPGSWNVKDSVFIYKELLAEGHLFNSKRYGIWEIVTYENCDHTKKSICRRTFNTDFYIDNQPIFCVGKEIKNGKISFDYPNKQGTIRFIHHHKNLSKELLIICQMNEHSNRYNCALYSGAILLASVSSENFNAELNKLYTHYYNKEIFQQTP